MARPYLPAKKVCQRYGVTEMSIWRWLKRGAAVMMSRAASALSLLTFLPAFTPTDEHPRLLPVSFHGTYCHIETVPPIQDRYIRGGGADCKRLLFMTGNEYRNGIATCKILSVKMVAETARLEVRCVEDAPEALPRNAWSETTDAQRRGNVLTLTSTNVRNRKVLMPEKLPAERD